MTGVICASLVLFDSTLRYVATGVAKDTRVRKFFGGRSEPEDDRDTVIRTAIACATREVSEECGISPKTYTVDDEPVYVRQLSAGPDGSIGHQYFFFAAARGALVLPTGDFDGEMIDRNILYVPRFIQLYLSNKEGSCSVGFHHTIALVRTLAHIQRHYGDHPLLYEFNGMLKQMRPPMELDALEGYLWSHNRRMKEQVEEKV